MLHGLYRTAGICLMLVFAADAFSIPVKSTVHRHDRSVVTTRAAKGFGSDSSSSSKPSTRSQPSNRGEQLNWCPTLAQVSDLPQQAGTISIIDTNLPTLTNAATNPTGAVAVAKSSNGNTYCFSISCPQCKIPLTKAKLLDGGEKNESPRLACNFCKSTYDLRTGNKVESAPEVSGGMFSGIVKNIFSAQEGGPLPVYKLGEKGGKVLIAFD